jgi:hypothetical protein
MRKENTPMVAQGLQKSVLRIRGFFDPWFRDPGWVKNQDEHPGSY